MLLLQRFKTKDMKIIFATNNKNKLFEIQNILGSKFEVLSLNDIGCNIDIPETGKTLEENALMKAKYVVDHYHINCIAEDSGLMVDSLNGAPGVYSARYASMNENCPELNHNSEANVRCLLKEMNAKTNRHAYFRTVIVLLEKNSRTGEFEHHFFSGEIYGQITKQPMGNNGFAYDTIFMPDGYNQTFAQMTIEQKNSISHRSIATNKLCDYLTKKRIYFGGRFLFMYKDYTKEKLSEDYRARLLGNVDLMLNTPKNETKSVSINDYSEYIGPFYFYEEGTSASDIVLNEFNMVENCTDIVFLLDNEPCPGTISELIHASFLHKNIYIFYVKTTIDDGEPENEINSKQWYAIKMSSIVNKEHTHIYECATYEEGSQMIIKRFK